MGIEILRWSHSAALSPVQTAPDENIQTQMILSHNTYNKMIMKSFTLQQHEFTISLRTSKKSSGQHKRPFDSTRSLNLTFGSGHLLQINTKRKIKESKRIIFNSEKYLMQVVEYKIIVTMLLRFLLNIKYSTFYHTSVPHHIKSIDIVDVSVLPLSM